MANEICSKCGGSGLEINAEQLRTRRLVAEISLSETARRMGISVSYLNDLEKGRRNWDRELLAKFNKALAK
jgi:transcriptional regulator with XRE-family HTH domain